MKSHLPKSVSWILAVWLCASPSFAANPPPSLTRAADELIALIEKADPMTTERKASWEPVVRSLKAAATQAETAQGFRLSASRILSAWEGRGLRILDDTDAQFYALAPESPPLREAGAWFARKGAKWYVKQVSVRASQIFHRGDALIASNFHPTKTWSDAGEQSIRVLEQPLAKPQDRQVKVQQTTMSEWALAESQRASSVLPMGGKRICQEKVWLWYSEPVSAFLRSKIKFAQDNCDALLVDLRDSFGEGAIKGEIKGRRGVPTVVLINQDSRENVVALALRLKDELGATVIGEPSAAKLSPLARQSLKELPWLLLVYESGSGSLLPDETVADSWTYGAGIDNLYDAGLQSLKKSLNL